MCVEHIDVVMVRSSMCVENVVVVTVELAELKYSINPFNFIMRY